MEIFGPFYKLALLLPALLLFLPSILAFLVTLCDWKTTLLAHIVWGVILVLMWHMAAGDQQGLTILVAILYSLIALPTIALSLKILSFPTMLLVMLWRKIFGKKPKDATIETETPE